MTAKFETSSCSGQRRLPAPFYPKDRVWIIYIIRGGGLLRFEIDWPVRVGDVGRATVVGSKHEERVGPHAFGLHARSHAACRHTQHQGMRGQCIAPKQTIGA